MPLSATPLPAANSLNLIPPDLDYEYFRWFRDFPFEPAATALSLANAAWLSDASFLVYANHTFSKKELAAVGLPSFESFDTNGSTQAFVASNAVFAIVAFRGTELKRLNGVRDVFTDLRFELVDSGFGGRVHAGFLDALDEVWKKIRSHLDHLREEHPSIKIWFTGHSLGGALATIAADRYPKTQGVYTFGAPRVGDNDFRQGFRRRLFRFSNNNDIISVMPPPRLIPIPKVLSLFDRFVPDFVHVGQPVYIDDQGKLSFDDSLLATLESRLDGHLDLLSGLKPGDVPADGIVDHAPILYSIHLWNALR